MEEFLLSETPKLKIIVFKETFEIHRSGNYKAIYILKDVDSVKIGKRVNWLVSAFSFIVGIFIGGSGAIYKERDQLKFNYKNKPIVQSLKGCNQNLAIKATTNINEKIEQALNPS